MRAHLMIPPVAWRPDHEIDDQNGAGDARANALASLVSSFLSSSLSESRLGD